MDDLLAVDATGVTKTFGPVRAVDDITVQVAPGEVYGVLGPNGAGKTTFLRMLFGLIRPDAGTIRVFGKTWDADGVGVLDGVAGFIESPRFYPYLTGRQNLEGLALLDGGARPGLLEEVLDVVDLDRPGRPTRSAATPTACGSGSAWPPACCASRGCWSSTSPPTAWTPPASATCARWSSGSPAAG